MEGGVIGRVYSLHISIKGRLSIEVLSEVGI